MEESLQNVSPPVIEILKPSFAKSDDFSDSIGDETFIGNEVMLMLNNILNIVDSPTRIGSNASVISLHGSLSTLSYTISTLTTSPSLFVSPSEEESYSDAISVDSSLENKRIPDVIESKPFVLYECVSSIFESEETETDNTVDIIQPSEIIYPKIRNILVDYPLSDNEMKNLLFNETLAVCRADSIECVKGFDKCKFNLNTEPILQIGEISINIENRKDNVEVCILSEFCCDGNYAKNSIFSVTNQNLSFIEEKKTECCVSNGMRMVRNVKYN